jgi:uncharacterized DUF497 family protein
LDFEKITGFDWDDGNISKNWLSHKVYHFEAEQIFFNQPLLISDDEKHSQKEKRYYALGVTDNARFLFIAFTIHKNHIRIISARDMNRKERKIYHEKAKEDTEI